MALFREKTDLDKKGTWYLFLAANLVIILGCAITWALAAKGTLANLWIATLVCNLAAIILCALFIWLEVKNIAPKSMHFQKKWLKFYLVAIILFIAAILFNSMFYVFVINESAGLTKYSWQLLVHFFVTVGLTLVSIGFQRYARFRIDLDIYRRKHGEEIKQKAEEEKNKPVQETKKSKPSKPADPSAKASGGLLEQM